MAESDSRPLIDQFAKFTGVGFVSAIGHYGVLISLVQFAAVPPVLASAAGALLGAWINYSLNYRYTFRSTRQHRESVLRFGVVAGIGQALNTLFMWLGVEVFGIHYLLSQIITTGLVLIWSFAGNRYWTFHSAAGIE